jgi:hypothetical protein
VFAFRLRVLDVGGGSYLGIVEGFPMIMAQSESAGGCEAELTRLLVAYLDGLRDEDATRIQLDDFPTVRMATLYLASGAGRESRSVERQDEHRSNSSPRAARGSSHLS